MSPVDLVPDGVRIRVRVQPRAKRSEVAGLHGDAVRIRVAAPPADGAANAELLRFLARLLRVPQGAVDITAGHASRDKSVRVAGMRRDEVVEALGIPA